MSYKYILIAILTVFFSCQNKQEKQNDLVVFENATEYNENTISFKDYRFVKLEYNMDAIVGEEIKIKFDDENIYVLDVENQGGLLRFDANGNFLNKIGTKGRGPKEYIEVFDFCIYNDTIDFMAGVDKLYIYRYLPDGTFIKQLEIPPMSLTFEYLPDGNYVFNPDYRQEVNYRLITMDQKENKLNEFLRLNNNRWVSAFQYPGVGLSKVDDIIVFGDNYNDTIYNITNQNATPRYIMDFGDLSHQSLDYSNSTDRREFLLETMNKGLWYIRRCYETKDYLIVEYWRNKTGSDTKFRILAYNKTNGKKTTLTLDDKKSLRRNFMGLTKNNEMVFIMYPFGDEFEEFKQLFPDAELPTLGETDNAMIMYCKL